MLRLPARALLVTLLAAPVAVQSPTWSLVPCPMAPAPRWDHSVAFDAARGRLVLFGGRGQDPWLYSDTWEFDGAAWSLRAPTSAPSGRWAQALAYLPATARVTLFGGTVGHLGQSIDDTWEWDGQSWQRRSPATAPPRRLAHAMVANGAGDRVILFGGRDDQLLYGDTWAWDGATWTLLTTTGPPARCWHDLALDAARDRVVLFGGWNQVDLGDTWEFDGIAWHRHLPAVAPSPRSGHRMAGEGPRGGLILHGGTTGAAETWRWDGATWTLLATTPATARSAHDLDFDPTTDRLTMFGGASAGAGETWTFGVSVPATLSTFGVGCPGSAGTPVLQAQGGGLPWIGRSFTFTLAPVWNVPVHTLAFLAFGWSDTTCGATPLPFALAPLGAPGCELLVSHDAVIGVAALQTANFPVSLPYAPDLVGVRFFNQGIVADVFANALGLSISNATIATVGWP